MVTELQWLGQVVVWRSIMLELHVNHPTLFVFQLLKVLRDGALSFIAEIDFIFVYLSVTAVEDELDYVGILNRALPEDIRVFGWCPVPPGFSARYCSLTEEILQEYNFYLKHLKNSMFGQNCSFN